MLWATTIYNYCYLISKLHHWAANCAYVHKTTAVSSFSLLAYSLASPLACYTSQPH